MSVALMTAVWRLALPSTEKMVLLALADAANDDGVTWLAVNSKRAGKADLRTKTSLSERAIQGAIARLCEGGYLERKETPGRGVVYTVTPAGDAPPQEMRPRSTCADPRISCGVTVSNHHITSGTNVPSVRARAKPRAPAGDFDGFWEAYPSKVGKRVALTAYERAIRRIGGPDPPGAILEGVERAKLSRQWREGYIPNPATWLNQDRWEDQPDPMPRQTDVRPDTRQSPRNDRLQRMLAGAVAATD